METLLDIHLFGKFHISNQHYQLLETSRQNQLAITLIAYLITHAESRLPKDSMIDILWPEEELQNPAGSLRTLIYRARRELQNFFPNEAVECICFSNDSYYWNPDVPCKVDIYEFEDLRKLIALEKDAAKRYQYCKQMHTLYTGDFMPNLSSMEWVSYRSIYYRNHYIQCTLQMCDFLYRQKAYDSLLSLCDAACLISAEEEHFHEYKIKAYLQKKVPQRAFEQYRSSAAFFSQKLGVDITGSTPWQTLYSDIMEQLPNNPLDLHHLEESLKDKKPEPKARAFYCNFDMFKNLYQFSRRSTRHSYKKRCLVLFTLLDTRTEASDMNILRHEMSILLEIISTGLRQNDIFTRNNFAQISLILTNDTIRGSQTAIRRISEKYNQKKEYDFIVLTAEAKLIE